MKFHVRNNLTPLRKKSHAEPDLSKEDLLVNPPEYISRRQYYSQVQALFDPTGFLSPVLLQGKILLRMTWESECKELGWHDRLPKSVTEAL